MPDLATQAIFLSVVPGGLIEDRNVINITHIFYRFKERSKACHVLYFCGCMCHLIVLFLRAVLLFPLEGALLNVDYFDFGES